MILYQEYKVCNTKSSSAGSEMKIKYNTVGNKIKMRSQGTSMKFPIISDCIIYSKNKDESEDVFL